VSMAAPQSGFERYTKKTRRALFLEEMEQVVPWAEFCALIEPVYPKAGQGRPPVGVERMLRGPLHLSSSLTSLDALAPAPSGCNQGLFRRSLE